MSDDASTPNIENKEAAPSEDDKILDIDELIEPVGSIKINGKKYNTVQMGSMGLIDQKRVENMWKSIQEIRTTDSPTK